MEFEFKVGDDYAYAIASRVYKQEVYWRLRMNVIICCLGIAILFVQSSIPLRSSGVRVIGVIIAFLGFLYPVVQIMGLYDKAHDVKLYGALVKVTITCDGFTLDVDGTSKVVKWSDISAWTQIGGMMLFYRDADDISDWTEQIYMIDISGLKKEQRFLLYSLLEYRGIEYYK